MDASTRATTTLAIGGPIRRSDLEGPCTRVCALLEQAGGAVVDCHVAGIAADAVSIDAPARLQLAARRHDCRIRLRDASAELTALAALLGLGDVLTS